MKKIDDSKPIPTIIKEMQNCNTPPHGLRGVTDDNKASEVNPPAGEDEWVVVKKIQKK